MSTFEKPPFERPPLENEQDLLASDETLSPPEGLAKIPIYEDGIGGGYRLYNTVTREELDRFAIQDITGGVIAIVDVESGDDKETTIEKIKIVTEALEKSHE